MYAAGEFVIRFAFEASPEFGLAYAAPLFEKEGDFVFAALIAKRKNPVLLHGAGAGAAFAADNHPVDVAEIELAEIFEERLDGEETDGGICFLEIGDARDAVFFVFDTDAPPDVRLLGGEFQFGIEQSAEPFRTLGEDLISVPVGFGHDGGDVDDVVVGDETVEEVAHGVDEDHFGLPPAERFGEFFGNEARVEALFVGMALDAAETLGEGFSVAMFAAGTDFGAAADGVPGCVSPFD